TYYFVIYAKKNFLVQSPEQGYMITRPYISKQAVKVIITKPDAGFDRPIAPPSPPFGIKVDEDGQSVRFDGASLVLEKRWYALFDEQRDRWEQVSFSDYEENRLLEPGHEGYDNKKESTIVNYLPGYSVVPHVVKYSEALNAVRVLYNRDNIMYSDLLQPQMQAFEIPQNRVTVPDLSRDEDQRFTFDVSGLAHNTTYLAWITVENQNGTSSDPSDPIIITTPADVPEIPITPIVPDDLSGIAGPNFVDLFWSYRANMEYEIRGGKIDSLDQAPISRRVTYEEIRSRTFIRMQDLDPDTVYYFWIRAISMTSTGTEIVSDYSNPLIIKTEAYRPPAPPTGFGIENGPDGVSENSITYVWTDIEGLEYVLEISEDLNFNESRKFNVTNGSHKVTGLISNRRYYARLYAYNPNTDLYSQPTRAILVTTNRSRADYDSSFDLNDPIYGDGLSIAGKLEDGIWIVSSLGANGHVLSERIREQYHSIIKIDLSVPPAYTTTIRLELSSEVIDALANLKKELYLVLPWGQYTIRPGTFHTDEYFKQININNEIAFRLETVSPSSQYNVLSTMEPKAPTTDFKFSYINNLDDSNNSWTSPIGMLNKPIRVEIPIEGISKYSQGQLRAFNYNYAQGWYRLSAITDYYMGSVIAQLDKPGAIVVATEGVKPTNITPTYVKESLDRVQSIYDLKSIKDKAFNHNKLMTYKDVLMLVFDVLDAKYDEYDVVNKAISAGLINSNQGIVDTSIRRDRAADLLVSLYRFKTRERTVPNKPTIWSHYTDLSKAEQKYLDSYKFALEIGIIQGNSISLAYPERLITLGEFIVMLDRT
ncbi:MAG TPA: fibronectin type III domain-containing protein, partial [Clostridia bacterium]|nr:fibronectin type III domain-containing protein [Clostridia bacterium]